MDFGDETCIDCCQNFITDEENCFVMVCTKPHLLVFAKFCKYPLWPAKVMKVEENLVRVEFFGDHKEADIPSEDCFLLTAKLLSKTTNNESFKEALEELKIHIQKIKERFGSFIPFESKMTISADNWENQLEQMIPGAFNKKPSTAPAAEGPIKRTVSVSELFYEDIQEIKTNINEIKSKLKHLKKQKTISLPCICVFAFVLLSIIFFNNIAHE
ncbi:protein kinase C-binding protein 1-like [Contarinia nasturtii]|uniref:protein kinase C-binding protein 1-like n=1 Tax=Contarinia nasturtii TaxID=265458 RepID=UPI0012D4BAAE|nr:protein kinase C-binding protein 1-like [Contarinia nasturtii]